MCWVFISFCAHSTRTSTVCRIANFVYIVRHFDNHIEWKIHLRTEHPKVDSTSRSRTDDLLAAGQMLHPWSTMVTTLERKLYKSTPNFARITVPLQWHTAVNLVLVIGLASSVIFKRSRQRSWTGSKWELVFICFEVARWARRYTKYAFQSRRHFDISRYVITVVILWQSLARYFAGYDNQIAYVAP